MSHVGKLHKTLFGIIDAVCSSVKSILLHRERILHAKVNSCRRIFSSRSCSWKTNRCLTNCFHISSIKKIRQIPPLLYRLVQKSSPKALKRSFQSEKYDWSYYDKSVSGRIFCIWDQKDLRYALGYRNIVQRFEIYDRSELLSFQKSLTVFSKKYTPEWWCTIFHSWQQTVQRSNVQNQKEAENFHTRSTFHNPCRYAGNSWEIKSNAEMW